MQVIRYTRERIAKETREPMEEQKKQQEEQQIIDTAEYSFLQEVIKDEVGATRKKKKRILRMTGLGFLIVLVACFTFSVCKPWVEKRLVGNPDEVTIPKDDKKTEASDGSNSDDNPGKDDYSRPVKSLNNVAKKGKRSVVSLLVLTGSIGNSEIASEGRSVSGAIIADNGQELLILGPKMKIEQAQQIQITFCDGKKYRAVEKMSDASLGLSVYAVDRSQLEEKTWKSIRMAVLGSSYAARVGDTVVLLGKLFGQGEAVGYGILKSSTEINQRADGIYTVLGVELAGFTGGSGVMFNREGEVIGLICDAAEDGAKTDLMQAYAISDIKDVIEYLSNGKNIPYIGIRGTDISENIAEDRKIPQGIYVEVVEANAPAMDAGIQSGDVITELDGKAVKNLDEYHTLLMEKHKGQHISVKGYRRGAKDRYVAIHFDVVTGSHEN